MARGVGTVVMVPVKVVGTAARAATDVVKQVDPLGTAKAAVVTTVTGNPAPLAGQIGGDVRDAINANAQKKADAAEQALDASKVAARVATAKTVMGERQAAPPKEQRDKLVPGEVFLAVSAPGYGEVRGKAGAYWLEPPRYEPDKKGKPQTVIGARAWLENVRLAPLGNKKPGEVENIAILITDPRVEETLVAAGGVAKLSVKVKTPGDIPLNLRVFAREQHKEVLTELTAQAGGIYAGELTLHPKTEPGETIISVVALRAEPVEVSVGKTDKGDPLFLFARELDELRPDKPFEFDPRIFAAENRLDIILTVLDPRLNTPMSPAAAPTAPVLPTAAPPPAVPAPMPPP